MKKILIFFSLVLISFGLGCSSKVNNSIELRSLAWGEIHFNFNAESIRIPAGNAREQVITLKELPKGLFPYSTTYEIPANATSSQVQGDVSGTLDIDAGTKILVLYSSTFIDGKYTLYATVSTNEPIEVEDDSVNP